MALIQTPASLGTNPTTKFANPAIVYGTVGSALSIFAVCDVEVDATNLYLSAQLSPSTSTGAYTFTATVYVLQESFS
jgi:hypothetical protein